MVNYAAHEIQNTIPVVVLFGVGESANYTDSHRIGHRLAQWWTQ